MDVSKHAEMRLKQRNGLNKKSCEKIAKKHSKKVLGTIRQKEGSISG